jgi:hypothetical protein
MKPGEVEAKIRSWADEHRLPEAHRDRWLALAEDDRAAMLTIAETLRLRTGQFVAALELLEEIAVRENAPIAEILARPDLHRIIDGAGSAPGKARALIDALRAIRFPRLREAADRIAAQVADLALPAGIRLVLPRDLSSDDLRVQLTAHGGIELRKLLDALAGETDHLCRIADALSGVDKI